MVHKAGNASQRRPINQWNSGNPLEVLKDLTAGVARDFADDFFKGTASDLISETESLFGIKPGKKNASGILAPEEVLDLTVLKTREEVVAEGPKRQSEPSFRPLAENFIFRQQEKEIKREVEAILNEIKKEVKRLDEATRNLEKETARVVVEDVPPNPGVYHVNFFEWLFGLLKNIRQKVEDAGVWLSLSYSRKAKRKYWAKFKKHGTSFGLSSDRVVATQTG